jgi:hypothetical protein
MWVPCWRVKLSTDTRYFAPLYYSGQNNHQGGQRSSNLREHVAHMINQKRRSSAPNGCDASTNREGFMFIDYPISTADIVIELSLGLCQAPTDGLVFPSDRDFAVAVKGTLSQMGQKREFHAYPRKCDGNQECMWDASWWLESETGLRLALAAESEWGKSADVKDDFEKLLVAKCPLKLLITDSRDKVAGMKDRLERSLRHYRDHVEGELSVWIDLKGSLRRGELRAFEYKANKSGSDETAAFEEVHGGPAGYSLMM